MYTEVFTMKSDEKELTGTFETTEVKVSKKKQRKLKNKQKKFDKKQRKVDKKQNKLDKKKEKAKKITKHKQKKFDKKQRKIDRKQRKVNKKGVKWGILPAEILPAKKYNNAKEFFQDIKNKLHIKNKKLRIFVRIIAIILCVVLVFGLVSGIINANKEKKWLDETNQKIQDISIKLNNIVTYYGGEPVGEDNIMAIQRKLDTIIRILENKNLNAGVVNQVDDEIVIIDDAVEEAIDVIEDNASSSSLSSSSLSSSSSSSGSSSTSASKVPSTKAQIIAYCNAALNRVKSDKPGYNKHYVMDIKGDVGDLPSWLTSLAKANETSTVKKGESSNNSFPASGYSWSSKLTEKDVSTATLKQSGSKYIITIKLGEEDNPTKGDTSHYGRCMSVMDANDVKAKSSLIKSVDMHYYNGYIQAEVDSKSGKLSKVTFSATADLKLNVALLGDISAKEIVSTETITNFVW